MNELLTKAKQAKEATLELNMKNTDQKNQALHLMAEQLTNETAFIIQENEKDVIQAKQNGLSKTLIDRLILSEERIYDMAEALKHLANLPDPIGDVLESWDRPNGMNIEKVRVPLGVIGMIYEARPNVTVDAASLCLKTGNAVLLRGSSSALNSNMAIVAVIHHALKACDFPVAAVQLLEDTSRETASHMFTLNEYLDVLIPRGGQKLIQTVVEQSTVPVLETGAGNCHLFIDDTADVQMAIDIAVNAKTQRPSVCNTIESLVVQADWAREHLPELIQCLQSQDVELRADNKARAITDNLFTANDTDWETEYLDKILAIKIVSNVDEAINHINHYGSKHSEAIISESADHVQAFFNSVDAAALYHNASTRFTDGFEFGFGAEIGISTQKLHARGPMGLPALTSTKYMIRGTGQVKA
ncbi:glutamate-5-semialdehyde dehydrogenase [Tuberibacillus sp. Marseille-P3662]|uniref:glutamate-5-semialdehyde dehydrogenase n=1 Tax=Tuberibacillus sp. Marseille-P3662 TaxID=1965358 RepID=UPI000A1C98E4|nr:glutamate-5-semialdehyde dehydrogenase [Tuberibacillus sp. Marseille-P3662]